MLADLIKSECDERMEFYKTIVGKREYEIERTKSVKNTDGSESLVTFKIVTDHKEVYLINCNMGQCFTSIGEEPTSGKEAMIQRTVALMARKETHNNSSNTTFESNLKKPHVASNIADFRLFTSIVGFVRLSIMGIDWLQPDFAVANLIFKEGDRMLTEEYGMPKPEPRRLVKRTENLKTECVKEAVARVYFFKQPAMAYEAGRPNAAGRGKDFDIGDLWDVIRTMRPTREMILAVWSNSLEYSIATSCHGVNVMNGVCEKMGFMIERLFRRLPKEGPEELAEESMGAYELSNWMNEILLASDTGAGIRESSLDEEAKRMRDSRILRNQLRIRAQDKPQDKQPMQAIASVIGGDAATLLKFTDAAFPTILTASMYYDPSTLLKWALGNKVEKRYADPGRGGNLLKFKERKTEGGSKSYDFGWMSLCDAGNANFGAGAGVGWGKIGKLLKESPSCTRFDMHVAGIADALFMLSTAENSRLCPEMPILPPSCGQDRAFVDENESQPKATSMLVGLRKFETASGEVYAAHEGTVIDARRPNGPHHRTKIKIHERLDVLHQRCRLPALQPHTSTRISKTAPLRRGESGAIEVNSVTLYEHVSMLMEAVLRCTKIAGLRGLHERFASGGRAPPGLTASNTTDPIPIESHAPQEPSNIIRKLPYSYDICQIAWTHDLASRLYSPSRDAMVASFNNKLVEDGLLEPLAMESLPEITLRYPGFPLREGDEAEAALRLVSLKIPSERPTDQRVIDISSASPIQELDSNLLRYETEVALGRSATQADVEEHRKTLIGDGFVWGVEGDVFSYDTWANHVVASMAGRGNVDTAVDERGVPVDAAFNSVADAEFLFDLRLLERRVAAGDPELAHVTLDPTNPSTYTAVLAGPIVQYEITPASSRKRQFSQFSGMQLLQASYKSQRVGSQSNAEAIASEIFRDTHRDNDSRGRGYAPPN